MNRSRISAFLIAMAMTVSLSLSGAAQSAYDQLMTEIENAEAAYTQILIPAGASMTTPGSMEADLPAIGNIIIAMPTDADGERLFDLFTDMSNEDGYTIEKVSDLGDEAALIEEPTSSGTTETILFARSGAVVYISIGSNQEGEAPLLEDILAYMIETDPSTGDETIDENGNLTGGWVDAFPQPEDIPGLEDFEAAAVVDFNVPQPIEIATPVRMAPEIVATPEN